MGSIKQIIMVSERPVRLYLQRGEQWVFGVCFTSKQHQEYGHIDRGIILLIGKWNIVFGFQTRTRSVLERSVVHGRELLSPEEARRRGFI